MLSKSNAQVDALKHTVYNRSAVVYRDTGGNIFRKNSPPHPSGRHTRQGRMCIDFSEVMCP